MARIKRSNQQQSDELAISLIGLAAVFRGLCNLVEPGAPVVNQQLATVLIGSAESADVNPADQSSHSAGR